MNSLNPVKTISNHISEVIRAHSSVSKSEAREQAGELLSDVGIKRNRIDDYPHEFSGGMRQRVIIAMALALSPRLLIADEPTSALDVVMQRQILNLLKKKIEQKKLSLLFITHEIMILDGLVDNVAVMNRGEIVEIGPLRRVLDEPLHPSSEMLLASVLNINSEMNVISKYSEKPRDSSVTSQGNRCRYSNRCKYAFERCFIESPKLEEATPGRFITCHKYN